MKKVAIKNLACIATGLSKDYYTYLTLNGFQIVSNIKNADFILVISCAALTSMEEKTKCYIAELKRKKKKMQP